MGWIRQTAAGVILNVRVVPRASRQQIDGLLGDALKIRLQAPPVEGKANKALTEFLSTALDVPRNRIAILAGETGRLKRVSVQGLDQATIEARLRVR